jgi:hypothetical protein
MPSQYSDLLDRLLMEFCAQNDVGMVTGVASHVTAFEPF